MEKNQSSMIISRRLKVDISIFGNLKEINNKSFSNTDINSFLFCGNQTVEGNFLQNAKSYNNITVYKYYPNKQIGDVKPNQTTTQCPNYKEKEKYKLPKLYIVIIAVSCTIIVTAITIVAIRVQFVRKRQKKIEGKMLLEKLVNDDFG